MLVLYELRMMYRIWCMTYCVWTSVGYVGMPPHSTCTVCRVLQYVLRCLCFCVSLLLYHRSVLTNAGVAPLLRGIMLAAVLLYGVLLSLCNDVVYHLQ